MDSGLEIVIGMSIAYFASFLGLALANTKIGDPLLGIIIPGIILLISMLLTWALYKRFSKKSTDK